MKFNWQMYKLGKYDAFYLGVPVFPKQRLDNKIGFVFEKGAMTGSVQFFPDSPPEELTMEFKEAPDSYSLFDAFLGIFIEGSVTTERGCYCF